MEALLPNSGNGAAKVVPQVAERSGGNPLFAEEMVNRLLEEDTVEATRSRARSSRCSPPASIRSIASNAGCSSRPP